MFPSIHHHHSPSGNNILKPDITSESMPADQYTPRLGGNMDTEGPTKAILLSMHCIAQYLTEVPTDQPRCECPMALGLSLIK